MDLNLERRIESGGTRFPYPNPRVVDPPRYIENNISWSLHNDNREQSKPLLPVALARYITFTTKSATLVLRVGNYLTNLSLDVSKLSTLTSLGVLRRAVDGVIFKASADVAGSTKTGKSLMNLIDQIAISGTLVVAAGFQFSSSGFSMVNYLSQDALHLINGIVGESETSKAIRSIGLVIAKELGDGSAIYALFTGLAYFAIVQSIIRNRENYDIKSNVLWDFVVLDASNKAIYHDDDESRIHSLISDIPKVGTISSDERTVKQFSVEISYPDSDAKPAFDHVPRGFTIVSEDINSPVEGSNRKNWTCNVVFERQVSDTEEEFSGSSLHYHTGYFPQGKFTHVLAKYMRYSAASYGQSFMRLFGIKTGSGVKFTSSQSHHSEHYSFSDHTKLPLKDILLSSFVDSSVEEKCGIPLVHFVSVDHEARAVVLTIRGTLGLEDLLADFSFGYEIFEWNGQTWSTHSGMLKCAKILTLESCRVLQTLKDALIYYGPDYGLIVCGHSLGAGVGALYSILLTEKKTNSNNDVSFVTAGSSALPEGRPVRCFCYGPPASVSEELRVLTKGLIFSVVYGPDVIPCLSLGLLRDFQAVAREFRSESYGINGRIWRIFLSQLGVQGDGSMDLPDDYTFSVLNTLRTIMQNEKLVPAGEIIHLTTHTVYEGDQYGNRRKGTRVIGRIVIDVEKKFRDFVLGREVFHHAPNFYERALNTLEKGGPC